MKYSLLLLAGLALPTAALAQTPTKVKTKIKTKGHATRPTGQQRAGTTRGPR